MPALATWMTKKEYVIKLGPQSDSQIELKVIIKSLSGGFATGKRIILLSRTHIGHLLDSTISFTNPLRNAARSALEKRLTKERNKTLAGSTLGGNNLKICLGSHLSSQDIFIFYTFSKCSL